MPSPRVATCIFCDDIRQEVGNKNSFMGIYDTDLIIYAPAPITLPKFAMVVWLICDIDDTPRSFTVTLFGPPGRTQLVNGEAHSPEAQLPTVEGATKFTAKMALQMANLQLLEPGRLEAVVQTERETLRAGWLAIKFEPPGITIGNAP